MVRPIKCRQVGFQPGVTYFKPRGIPLRDLEDVELAVDELEAIRLCDLEGLSLEEGASRMGISRATIGRILEKAHRKVAEALVEGKAIRVQGGAFIIDSRRFVCSSCGHVREMPFGSGPPPGCPNCGSSDFIRSHRGRKGRKMSRGRSRRRGEGGPQRS